MRLFVIIALALAGTAGAGCLWLYNAVVEQRNEMIALRQSSADARRVDHAIGNLQGQSNALRAEVGRINGDYAGGQKVAGGMANLQQQIEALKRESAEARKADRDEIARLTRDIYEVNGRLAGSSAILGATLLQAKEFKDAEPILRECLAIREKNAPDLWTTFNTRSMLGSALLGQKKYAEAEPLLLQGYAGMKQREATIPPLVKHVRLTKALEQLVQLYEATGKPDEVAKRKKEIEAIGEPADKPRNP